MNDMRDIRDRLKAGLPAKMNGHKVVGMQMRMSLQKGLLTIELGQKVDYLQFSKAAASNLIKTLVTYYNLME